MAWQTIAYKFAEQVGKECALKILDQIFKGNNNQLEESFNDAIRKIDISTRQAILDNELNSVRAKIDALSLLLMYYKNSPTDSLLENATIEANNLYSSCKTLSIVSPPGYGLAGHPFFMVAANLLMAIFQERVKKIGPKEKENLKLVLDQSKQHAMFMHEMWSVWTERRFTPLYFLSTMGWMGQFCYLFDGTFKYTGISCLGSQQLALQTNAAKSAEGIRQKHIEKELLKIENKFILPSQRVVTEWSKLLIKMNIAPFSEMKVMNGIWNFDYMKRKPRR